MSRSFDSVIGSLCKARQKKRKSNYKNLQWKFESKETLGAFAFSA